MFTSVLIFCFFFFNDTATTEIYTLSLHDALPIFDQALMLRGSRDFASRGDYQTFLKKLMAGRNANRKDRKSTRLNSSHANISYAVFCLKKKKEQNNTEHRWQTETKGHQTERASAR